MNLLHRAVPVLRTPEGLRALSKDRPVAPETVERYLESKLGAGYEPARRVMSTLARSFRAEDLAVRVYGLYEACRPEVPAGTHGWGAAGVLDLSRTLEPAK
ncbi:MAG: hypothetical protein M0015_02150 [Betaproteobacteria bacterium]|nr:hypothetical protein [Betaproteobacteria bacterium]